jgi:hypothetical protein
MHTLTQAHHEGIVDQIKSKECTACAVNKAKVQHFHESLEEHRGQQFPQQVAALKEELRTAKRVLARLKHDHHQLLSVSSSQTSSLQQAPYQIDYDMYLKDLK